MATPIARLRSRPYIQGDSSIESAGREQACAGSSRPNTKDCQEIAVVESFSNYLRQVAARLPDEAVQLVQGNLNLTLLDWYTDGIPAEEAAERIRRSAGWT